MRNKRPILGAMMSVILVMGIGLQLVTIFGELILPVGTRIWDVRDRPAWERTGHLSAWAGSDRTEFLGFLRNHTPPDATVIFFEQSGLYSWKPALQYFLFPRHIRVCPQLSQACWGQFASEPAYYVFIEGQPVADDLPYPVNFLPYPQRAGFGLYQPEPAGPAP